MKQGLFLSLTLACSIANAAAPAASVDTALATTPAPVASVLAATAPVTPAPSAPLVATAPVTPAPSAISSASSAGSLLQTILALGFVLALLAGLAWLMQRYAPKTAGGNAALRLVGSLSLGGRERIVVIEVADQWIVVGASPGRINALATLPRQETMLAQKNDLAGPGFSEWLKQTIEKRHGK